MKEAKTVGLWKIRIALGLIGKIRMHEFTKKSKNVKKSQEQTLREILMYAKDTVYGKEHSFSKILEASNPEELFALYKEHVSINDYEALKPYIERHKNGEKDILFPGKPKMYATTSGTTNEPKWIPITNKYYSEVYSKMNQTWLYLLMKNKPHVYDGPSISIVGKAIEGAAPDGTLYGSTSGIGQKEIPEFLKAVHTAPADVFGIPDYRSRYYAIMRMGIARDVHCIITANPSTLVEMQTNANEYYYDYVNDIEKGTISDKFDIPQEIRTALLAKIKPNPQRAEELRKLKDTYDIVLPKHYWPNLQVVNTWKCGNTRIYLDKVKDSFNKECLFMEFSYYASESRFGLVLDGKGNETVLAGHKVYIEFIHEKEIDSPNPTVYSMHELEKGKRYCPLVTTSSGMYRYNMNDLIEVSDFYNQFPKVTFIQKVNGIVTITGEKLHERQFIEAVRSTENETGLSLRFFVGFADLQASTYRIYYEFTDRTITQETAEHFTSIVDEKLKKMNMEYESKRESFRLKEPITALLQKDSFETFKGKCINMGYRDGQFKLTLLMQDEKRHSMFKELLQN